MGQLTSNLNEGTADYEFDNTQKSQMSAIFGSGTVNRLCEMTNDSLHISLDRLVFAKLMGYIPEE